MDDIAGPSTLPREIPSDSQDDSKEDSHPPSPQPLTANPLLFQPRSQRTEIYPHLLLFKPTPFILTTFEVSPGIAVSPSTGSLYFLTPSMLSAYSPEFLTSPPTTRVTLSGYSILHPRPLDRDDDYEEFEWTLEKEGGVTYQALVEVLQSLFRRDEELCAGRRSVAVWIRTVEETVVEQGEEGERQIVYDPAKYRLM